MKHSVSVSSIRFFLDMFITVDALFTGVGSLGRRSRNGTATADERYISSGGACCGAPGDATRSYFG